MEHQPARLLVGDAAAAQVEQLLVVEPGRGRGVTGSLDLAGLDLEVRHRVGLAAVGEHEVAVLLVGLDGLGDLADQHVADPHRARLLALQRALVDHVALGARRVVVDEEAVLEVLAGVGEVQTEQLGLAAGTGVVHVGAGPHDRAAEGDRDVAVARVAAHHGLVGADVHGVVVPVLQGDDGQVGAVTDDDLDVAGVHARAAVVQDVGGTRVRAGLDHGVAVGAGAGGAGDPMADRLDELGVGGDLHVHGVAGVLGGQRRGAVVGDERHAARGLPRRERADDVRRVADGLHGQAVGVTGGVVERAGEPLERREAPDLLAAGGHRVVVEVEGAHRVQVGLHVVHLEGGGHAVAGVSSHGHVWGVFLASGASGGAGGSDGRRQPTAPSICSSMRRLSSRAYSIGSSLAIGSTKPRTIIAIASSSSMPRDMR